MKSVKNFLFALLLVFAIAVSTPAGEQDTPGYAPPPPPPQQIATSDEETTDIGTNSEQDGGITAVTTDYLLLEALVALLSVY